MKWKKLPVASPEYLSLYPGDLSPLLAQLLYNRGIGPDEAEEFLAADQRLESDPYLLPDLRKAVARIKRAILNGETIAVFGDFDADGVTASAVLVQALEQVGGKVVAYIPHRVDEGHGLNSPALQKLRDQGAALVVTVDCGITAGPEAAYARDIGLDLIITDHHEVVGPIPQALAVVDPKLPDSIYPCRQLAGVGVAFKLVQALFRETGRDEQTSQFLDLVAVGTVADLVPLLGENRYLVSKGLEMLNQTDRPGIRAMLECAGRGLDDLDADTISFVLAPRLNAAGRLDHASISYDLLMATSYEEAWKLASQLEARNAERQQLTTQFTALAEAKLEPIGPDVPLLMVSDEEFHAGVNGVVAGKLADKYYRPAIVMELGEKESQGSCRSIPEFNIVAALAECSDLLGHFGGHAQAAGFGVPNDNLAALREKLMIIARRELAGLDLQPTLNIDAEIHLAAASTDEMKMIRKLEPCGQGNPPPRFLSTNVRVLDAWQVGSDGTHLRLRLGDRGVMWEAIGFGLNHLNEDSPPLIDVVYTIKVNRWRGQESFQLEVLDFVPSTNT